MSSAKTSVFFGDDRQRITLNDFGTTSEIERVAQELEIPIKKYRLTSQFRCNGSEGYIEWLDSVLQVEPNYFNYDSKLDFDFRVMDNSHELFKEIKRLNSEGHFSRLVAGYCWDWISKNDTSKFDITIGDFKPDGT